jgi:hypothetical protein
VLNIAFRAFEGVELKIHACKGFRVILYIPMKTEVSVTPTENHIPFFLSVGSNCTVFGTTPAVTATCGVL